MGFNHLTPYLRLNQLSPTPFSSFLKYNETNYLLCASPERFIKKEGTKITSQPIKGTIKRSLDDKENKDLQSTLLHDSKERAENLMIVDLVRNDLAMTAIPGTVQVEELFGIYPFQQVNQMISTISSKIDHTTPFLAPLQQAFPMGSMTGAPKRKAMELIDYYERSSRNLFSGAVGYISPTKEYDFNVVIRSIFYDDKHKKISFQVGSAITFESIPEKEYDECLLKAEAILQCLEIA